MKPAGEQEVLRLQPGPLDPGLQCAPSGLRNLALHRTLGLVLHDDSAVAIWSPWHTSRTLSATRSHPRSLLSMPKLKSASSRTRLSIWRRTRSAQMSFRLKLELPRKRLANPS